MGEGNSVNHKAVWTLLQDCYKSESVEGSEVGVASFVAVGKLLVRRYPSWRIAHAEFLAFGTITSLVGGGPKAFLDMGEHEVSQPEQKD